MFEAVEKGCQALALQGGVAVVLQPATPCAALSQRARAKALQSRGRRRTPAQRQHWADGVVPPVVLCTPWSLIT